MSSVPETRFFVVLTLNSPMNIRAIDVITKGKAILVGVLSAFLDSCELASVGVCQCWSNHSSAVVAVSYLPEK